MNAKRAQTELKELFSERFGKTNVKTEWRSDAGAEDWLRFGDIYAPRPDIAVGPFNIEEGRNISEFEDVFHQQRNFFNQLGISNFSFNKNPRCLIAIEIENSNKGKHMLGNIINASLLGKVGIIVTLREEFFNSAKNICNYLNGASERKKIGYNPSNIAIIRFEELRSFLL